MEKAQLALELATPAAGPELPTDRVKRIISLCLFICVFCLAYAETSVARFLFTLSDSSHISISQLATGFAVDGLGYVVGALLYGFLCHKINRQVAMQIACLTAGVAFFATPLLNQLYQHLIVKGIFGLSVAVIQVSAHAWLLELWPVSKSGSYMKAMYFMSNFGIFVAYTMALVDSTKAHHDFEPEKELAQMRITYKIAATVMILAAAVMTMLFGTRKYQQNNRTVKEGKEGEGEPIKSVAEDGTIEIKQNKITMLRKVVYIGIGVIIILLASLTLTLHTASLMPLLARGRRMSENVTLASVEHVTLSLTLLVGSLIAIKVNVKYIMLAMTPLLFVGNLLLLLATSSSRTSDGMFLAGCILHAIGQAVLVPGAFALMEEKVNVTNAVTGILLAAARISSVIGPGVVAQFNQINPHFFLYVTLPIIPSIAALLVLALLVAKRMS